MWHGGVDLLLVVFVRGSCGRFFVREAKFPADIWNQLVLASQKHWVAMLDNVRDGLCIESLGSLEVQIWGVKLEELGYWNAKEEWMVGYKRL